MLVSASLYVCDIRKVTHKNILGKHR